MTCDVSLLAGKLLSLGEAADIVCLNGGRGLEGRPVGARYMEG